jgi:hypothetical protein
MLNYEQIQKCMDLNGYYVWELYVVDSYNSSKLIGTNESAEEGESKKKLDDFVNLYAAQNPNMSFGIVIRKTKASNGAGLLPLQKFTKTGVSSDANALSGLPQNQNFQPQMSPDIVTMKDKLFEEIRAFDRDKSKFDIEKALFEYEKKHWISSNEEKEKALKELEKKFNSNSEAAADGLFRGARLIYEEVLGAKTPQNTPISGVESQVQPAEEMTENEKAFFDFLGEHNDFINKLSPENCAKALELVGNVFGNIEKTLS